MVIALACLIIIIGLFSMSKISFIRQSRLLEMLKINTNQVEVLDVNSKVYFSYTDIKIKLTTRIDSNDDLKRAKFDIANYEGSQLATELKKIIEENGFESDNTTIYIYHFTFKKLGFINKPISVYLIENVNADGSTEIIIYTDIPYMIVVL